jgi:hypothetical protein
MSYIESTYFETETITTSIQSKSGLILITFKKNPPEMKGVDEFHIHLGSIYLTTKTDYQDALSISLLYQHYDNESAIDDMNDRRNSIMKKVNEICHGPEKEVEPPSDNEFAEEEQYIIDEVLQRSSPSKADIHTIFERDTESTDPRDRKSLSQAIESHFKRPKP